MALQVYRQGDVLLIPLGESRMRMPATAVKSRSRLIRKGEHGGLHQLAKGSKAAIWNDNAPGDPMKYIEVWGETAKVVHGEHNTLEVPEGIYEVRIQREEGDRRRIERVVD